MIKELYNILWSCNICGKVIDELNNSVELSELSEPEDAYMINQKLYNWRFLLCGCHIKHFACECGHHHYIWTNRDKNVLIPKRYHFSSRM